jgi:hypothetical protein
MQLIETARKINEIMQNAPHTYVSYRNATDLTLCRKAGTAGTCHKLLPKEKA